MGLGPNSLATPSQACSWRGRSNCWRGGGGEGVQFSSKMSLAAATYFFVLSLDNAVYVLDNGGLLHGSCA